MEKIIYLIKKSFNIAEIRRFKINAHNQKNEILINKCYERIIEISGIDENNPIERRFKECLAAYEEYLYEKHGKKVKATYLRRKQKKAGTIQTIIDAVNKKQRQEGLELLMNVGGSEFAMESIVIEFPDQFTQETIENAKMKLYQI
tara:strand:+ start:1810 stop:2247 length:438 start_codon:yes stop_codon:yes gene_type:complete